MNWILNASFALGMILLIGLEFYPPLGNAFHQSKSQIALSGQYSEKAIHTFLSHSFGTPTSRNGSIMRKWKDDIRIKFHGTQNAEEKQFLQSNIKLLDSLISSQRIYIINEEQSDANMHIHIIPRTEFSTVFPSQSLRQGKATHSLLQWNNNSEIYSSTIFIDSNLSPTKRRNQLLRLLGRNLGLIGFSLKNEESVYAEESRTEYSSLDLGVLGLLYEVPLICGMTAEKAREQLQLSGAIVSPLHRKDKL